MPNAAYPGSVASFAIRVNLQDIVNAEDVNAVYREVVAIQQVIGTMPTGAFPTIDERISAAEVELENILDKYDNTGSITIPSINGLTQLLNEIGGAINQIGVEIQSITNDIEGFPDFSTLALNAPGSSQTIATLTAYSSMVRFMSTGGVSPTSENNGWTVGIEGAPQLKADTQGISAYDGQGDTATLALSRDGGSTSFGGDLNAAAMAPQSATMNIPAAVAFGALHAVATPLSAAAVTLSKLPQSRRVRIVLMVEALEVPASKNFQGQLVGFATKYFQGATELVSQEVAFSATQAVLLTGHGGSFLREFIITVPTGLSSMEVIPMWAQAAGGGDGSGLATIQQAMRFVTCNVYPQM